MATLERLLAPKPLYGGVSREGFVTCPLSLSFTHSPTQAQRPWMSWLKCGWPRSNASSPFTPQAPRALSDAIPYLFSGLDLKTFQVETSISPWKYLFVDESGWSAAGHA